MFYYNEKKDGEKFASIGCADWETANSTIEFSEAVFLSDEEFYYFFGYALSFSDCQKIGDKNWKWSPQLVTFKIAKKNYKGRKYDKDTGKWSDVDKEQSVGEKVVCKILESTEDDKFYKGKLQLTTDPSGKAIATGLGDDGKPVPSEMLAMLLAYRGTVTEIPESKHFKLEDVKLPDKKGGFNRGSSGQKEIERLGDKLQFICNQLSEAGIVLEKCNMGEIYKSMQGSELAMAIVELSKDIMS